MSTLPWHEASCLVAIARQIHIGINFAGEKNAYHLNYPVCQSGDLSLQKESGEGKSASPMKLDLGPGGTSSTEQREQSTYTTMN